MAITERVRRELVLLHSSVADILVDINKGTCPVAKINRVINGINTSITELQNLPLLLKTAAASAGLPEAEKAIVIDRAETARKKISKFLAGVESQLAHLEKGCPGILIETIEKYMVMSDKLVENRINHLTEELEEAEAMASVPSSTEAAYS